MLPLLSDENVNGAIVGGLLRREPAFDLVRVQDVGLLEEDDPAILQWAADNGRILLTHDRQTVPGFDFERVAQGLAMPGVCVLDDAALIGRIIEDVLLVAYCQSANDLEGVVMFLPFPS